MLLKHRLNQAVHILPRTSAERCQPKQGLFSLLIFEIKDLTYNAQFNFCLLIDRSESVLRFLAERRCRRTTRPRVV
jgi:hypothetical protein